MPESEDRPADEDSADPAPRLAEGLEPLPEHGPAAIGTRFHQGSLTFYRGVEVALAIAAIGVVAMFAPAFSQSAVAVVFAVVLFAVLVLSVVNFHLLAGFGTERPALVLTDRTLEVDVPFSRCTVDLSAVRDVTVLSRDLIVLAPGGVRRPGGKSGGRRAVISNVRSFAVKRDALADAIMERARAVRAED